MTSGLLEPSPLTAVRVEDQQTLEALLLGMNERGDQPVVVGLDRFGIRFLAYAWEFAGEEVYCGVITDDPRATNFDYGDVGSCAHCGAFERRSLDVLNFPVVTV